MNWSYIGNEFNLNTPGFMNAAKAKHNIMKLHFNVLSFNIFLTFTICLLDLYSTYYPNSSRHFSKSIELTLRWNLS